MLVLSQNTTVSSYRQPRSLSKPLNQIATFIAFVPVIYSISIVDKTIVNCNVASQLMAQLFLMCCLLIWVKYFNTNSESFLLDIEICDGLIQIQMKFIIF